MHPLRAWAAFVVAFVGAAIVLAHSPVRAQTSFDGTWSVLIITESGECDRGYRYSIRIRNGQIFYGGEQAASPARPVPERGGEYRAPAHAADGGKPSAASETRQPAELVTIVTFPHRRQQSHARRRSAQVL